MLDITNFYARFAIMDTNQGWKMASKKPSFLGLKT